MCDSGVLDILLIESDLNLERFFKVIMDVCVNASLNFGCLRIAMECVDNFRLRLGTKDYVPIMVGGMGVDISTSELALEVARLGGIGHISDAMVEDVADRKFGTSFVKEKTKLYKFNISNMDKAVVQFDLDRLAEATALHIGKTMEAKKGNGLIYVNCMEKLTMNSPRETLRTRLNAALDAGIDGITMSAGLHLGSFALIADHPRFREAHLGIIVSSVRALQVFLRKVSKLNRLPDYIIVEGPLAGGHLGFGLDWADYDLHTIMDEVHVFLKAEQLNIPVVAAGGIFTGSDAVGFLEKGAGGVQVATRFTITHECGLPYSAKQEYVKATEGDIIVNSLSPTGYPMRMLKGTPAIDSGIRPGCESYGYLLDATGNCAYINSYNREVLANPGSRNIVVTDKTCLCTHMRNFNCWTCGQTTSRLKDTTHRNEDGSYQLLSAEHVFRDYQFSVDNNISLPARQELVLV
jgi:nitronate monooxygenase